MCLISEVKQTWFYCIMISCTKQTSPLRCYYKEQERVMSASQTKMINYNINTLSALTHYHFITGVNSAFKERPSSVHCIQK